MPSPNVAVIGTGLLGASVGHAARRAGIGAMGFDRDPASVGRACADGAIQAVAPDVADVVQDVGLVVVAVPVSAAAAVLREVARHAPADAVVTDVCSVKRPVVAAARETGLGGRFIGAHPMAGSEHSGPAAARADLFDGRPCFVFPSDDAGATARVVAFWRSLGGDVRTGLTPAEHDAVMARVSHLPHAVAAALTLLAGDDARHAGPGFRDATRIAAGDAALWADILLANRDEVAAAAGELDVVLGRLRAALAAGDRAALEALLREASTRRRGARVP